MADIQQLFDLLKTKQWRVVTAESCTGGLISQTITNESGSSEFLDCGFVTYSNEAKIQHLDVSEQTLVEHGAVSANTAEEMAAGALKNAPNAQIAVSVTGVAGPGGGTAEKPVGLVYIGVAHDSDIKSEKCNFDGDREAVRKQTMERAIQILIDALS